MTSIVGSGLRYERGGRVIFSDLAFEVHTGERLAVVGPSGSGKTSLLTVLAGLAAADAGTIALDGTALPPGARPGFALVLQGYGLVSLLTAAENVEAALRAAGSAPSEAVDRAREALAAVGLENMAGQLVEELSGGQQQRVAVARALALRPEVMIADEPTAEQDPVFRALVLDRLFDVADAGGILVLATHDPEVAARCTRTVRIAPSRS